MEEEKDTTADLDVVTETVELVVAEEKDTTADLDVVTEKAVVVRMSDCLSLSYCLCVRALGAVPRVLLVERESGESGSGSD